MIKIAVFLLFALVSNSFATSYYVDCNADPGGDGTTDATTGGSCAWDTVADVNGATFSANDIIYFNKDCVWRETLTIPDSGTDGNPITFTNYGTGELPVISGATALSSWTDEGSNIWYASFATDPDAIFFTEAGPTYLWGKRETAKGNVDAEYDFWFDDPNNRIYVYSTSDPGTAYTAVDGSVRQNCIAASGTDYIVIDGLELRFAGSGGSDNELIGLSGVTDGWEVKNSYLHHVGHKEATERGDIIQISGGTGLWVHENTMEESGRHLVYLYAGSANITNSIIEKNYLHNGYHTHFDMNTGGTYTQSGNTFRYNLIHYDGTDLDGNAAGTYFNGNGQSMTDTKIYGNVWTGDNYSVINIFSYVNGFYFYNNSIYSTVDIGGSSVIIVESNNISNIFLKNNSIQATDSSQIYNFNSMALITSDYNILYNPTGNLAYIGSSLSWAAYQSAYPSQDANSYNENPDYTNGAGFDLTLSAGAPGIETGVNLGSTYGNALDPASSWPDSVALLDQYSNGDDWEIGAYVYEDSPPVPTPASIIGGSGSGTLNAGSGTIAATP